MPLFTMPRNYSLSSKKGHVITFVKGEKTHVPPECVPETVAIGAVPEIPTDFLPPEKAEVQVMPVEDKKKIAFAAFEKMLLRSQRGDFSASGLPNIQRLETLMGLPVDIKERDSLWTEFNTYKNEAA